MELKNRRTHEIMDAESIGLADNSIVLGKHSGRHAFRSRLTELGYVLDDGELNSAFARFKELADKKKEISNADIGSLVNDEIRAESENRWKIDHIQVQCGDKLISTATVSVRDDANGKSRLLSKEGTGPVDAVYKALDELTEKMELQEYLVSSVTKGIDALGEVTVRLRDPTNGRIAIGRSSNTDVIVASAQAYLNAINRLDTLRGSELPTHPQFSTSIV